MEKYSTIIFFVLLFLGSYCLIYETWLLPPSPALEENWAAKTPFRVMPNQSVTVRYTITYNWTGTATVAHANDGTHLEIENRRAPADTFEVREIDIGTYYIRAGYYRDGSCSWVGGSNANYHVEIYLPSGELLKEYDSTEGRNIDGFVFSIKEPGTYRIKITNVGLESFDMMGEFQFTRNRFYKPYMRFGYVTLPLALGFLIVGLIKLRNSALTLPKIVSDLNS